MAKRRAWVGIDKLSVQDNNLVKTIPELYVDLSSIVKGYGVDVVAEYLESAGINNYMVDIGGEVRTKGTNGKEAPWRIAIEKPAADGVSQTVQEVIEPGDSSIATSGDYRNYFEQDGVRFSHTIDPKSGRPITHNLVSITVIADNCMSADGLSTGLNVLGPEAGFALAEKMNIPVFMIVKTDKGFEERYTKAFEPFLTKKQFLLAFLGMSLGYIFKRKSIQGSCGGLSSIGVDKVCDCPEPCDARKKRMAREEARQKMLEKNRIL